MDIVQETQLNALQAFSRTSKNKKEPTQEMVKIPSPMVESRISLPFSTISRKLSCFKFFFFDLQPTVLMSSIFRSGLLIPFIFCGRLGSILQVDILELLNLKLTFYFYGFHYFILHRSSAYTIKRPVLIWMTHRKEGFILNFKFT